MNNSSISSPVTGNLSNSIYNSQQISSVTPHISRQKKLSDGLSHVSDVGSQNPSRNEERGQHHNRKSDHKSERNKRYDQARRNNDAEVGGWKSPEFVVPKYSIFNNSYQSNFEPGPQYPTYTTHSTSTTTAPTTSSGIAPEPIRELTAGDMSRANQQNEDTACDAYSREPYVQDLCLVMPRKTWQPQYRPCPPMPEREQKTVRVNQEAFQKGYFELKDFLEYGPTCFKGFAQDNVYNVKLPEGQMCSMRKETWWSGRAILIQCSSFDNIEPLDISSMTIPQMMEAVASRTRGRRSDIEDNSHQSRNTIIRRQARGGRGH